MSSPMPEVEINDAEMPAQTRKRVRPENQWTKALRDSWAGRSWDAQKQEWKGKGKNTAPLSTVRPDPSQPVKAGNRSPFDTARDAVRREATALEIDGVQLGVRTVINTSGCDEGTARLHFYATEVRRMAAASTVAGPPTDVPTATATETTAENGSTEHRSTTRARANR